jgi:hypothetical protein
VWARQWFCTQRLQDRHCKACGLSGAGLGADECIFAGEYDRNGLGLDRGGLRVAGIGNSAYELGAQAERFK